MQEWLKTTDALGDIIYMEGNYNSSLPLTQNSFIHNNLNPTYLSQTCKEYQV